MASSMTLEWTLSRGSYPLLLVLALSLPATARALGLGEIRVASALNEPLAAQIDIIGATPDELLALTATFANADVFQHFHADRPAFLSSAVFAVGRDARGAPVLNITSNELFTEPLVNVLVDVRWGQEELIRQYSLILDPAEFRPASRAATAMVSDSAPSQSTPPLASAVELSAPPVAAAANAPPTMAPMVVAVPAPSSSITSTLHRVVAGDTLHVIAHRAGAGPDLDARRIMIAIFRANPQAFAGNINRLRLGALLRIPATAEIQAITRVEAEGAVQEQMASWTFENRRAASRRRAAASEGGHEAGDATPAIASNQQDQDSPAETAAVAGLAGRVQSLQLTLDETNRKLAGTTAQLQDLQRLAVAAAVPQPTIIRPRAARSPATPTGVKALLSPAVLALVLLFGGLALARQLSLARRGPGKKFAEITADAELGVAPVNVNAAATSVGAVAAEQQVGGSVMPPAPDILVGNATVEITQSMATGMSANEAGHRDARAGSADADTVEMNRPSFGRELTEAELHAARVAMEKLQHVAGSKTPLDYNLFDLDGRAEHVEIRGNLNDPAMAKERRRNMVDSLRAALSKDPSRSDLRMKLLETLYRTAATNQRAFREEARNLTRDRHLISAEDWEKVAMMGREIAPDDGLFAESPEDDSLEECA